MAKIRIPVLSKGCNEKLHNLIREKYKSIDDGKFCKAGFKLDILIGKEPYDPNDVSSLNMSDEDFPKPNGQFSTEAPIVYQNKTYYDIINEKEIVSTIINNLKFLENDSHYSKRLSYYQEIELEKYVTSFIPMHIATKADCHLILSERLSIIRDEVSNAIFINKRIVETLEEKILVGRDFELTLLDMDAITIEGINVVQTTYDKIVDNKAVNGTCIVYCEVQEHPIKKEKKMTAKELGIVCFLMLTKYGYTYIQGKPSHLQNHRVIFNELLNNLENESKVDTLLDELNVTEKEFLKKDIYNLRDGDYPYPSTGNYKRFLDPSDLFGFRKKNEISPFLKTQLEYFDLYNKEFYANPVKYLSKIITPTFREKNRD